MSTKERCKIRRFTTASGAPLSVSPLETEDVCTSSATELWMAVIMQIIMDLRCTDKTNQENWLSKSYLWSKDFEKVSETLNVRVEHMRAYVLWALENTNKDRIDKWHTKQ